MKLLTLPAMAEKGCFLFVCLFLMKGGDSQH